MNETIAFRPEGRASTKDVVVNYTLASLDELEQLHPALNLLAHPSIVRGSHDFFVRCYDAGVQHAQAGVAETVAALPDSLPHERQRSGLLCAAAGRLDVMRQPLTHNRLCDLAGQFCAGMPDVDSETRSGFILCAAYRCRFTGGCCGINILTASACSRRCCTCWPGRAILPGRGSRRSGCSGRAACWVIKASLRL
ncbi:Membrane protein associated with oxaloacetate decarboxylase [Salmonella enterica subsp. enterica serovar Heidelberg str. 75-3547]|nr:Membrane protein associated with oxaloacetate decarboxylase [Salmonella enterica subsp. enterica serovar Heidelberg str. 75-3547]